MNCGNCGSPLNPGSDICPNCGVKNITTGSVSPQITANMAPPTLDVKNENLTAGVTDISSVGDVATYETPQVDETQEEKKEENAVAIDIPKVSQPVENIDMPDDGSAPDVSMSSETVGENLDSNSNVVPRKVTILEKLGLTNHLSNRTLIIAVIITLIIGLLLGKLLFSKNYCQTTKVSTTVTEKTQYIADGKNNITTSGDYIYTIPNTYNYDKINSGLAIYDENFKYRIYFKDLDGRYDYLASAKTSIKETLKEQGYSVNDIKEVKVDETSFVTMEVNKSGENKLLAYAYAQEDKVFYIEITTSENKCDYDILKVVADILNSVELIDEVSSLEKSPIFDSADLLVTASIEYNNLDKSINN